MATISESVYDGVLAADGTIHLDHPPEIDPGPVRVTLRPRPTRAASDLLLPDPPWPDESIPAPCDLPLLGPRKRIFPRKGRMPLPDPLPPIDEGEG
jgi:hypothetical protein